MTQHEYSRIVELFQQYNGTIKADLESVQIESRNTLKKNGAERKVKCKVRISDDLRKAEDDIGFDRFKWSTDGEEETLEIIGGCGIPCDDLDDALKQARKQLERYGFERKADQQLALF